MAEATPDTARAPSNSMDIDLPHINGASGQSPKSAQPLSSQTIPPQNGSAIHPEIIAERTSNIQATPLPAGVHPAPYAPSTSSWIEDPTPRPQPQPQYPQRKPFNIWREIPPSSRGPTSSVITPGRTSPLPPPVPFAGSLPHHAPPAFPSAGPGSADKRFSSVEKGKGRAPVSASMPESGSHTSTGTIANGNGNASANGPTTPAHNGTNGHEINGVGSQHDESGRGKREKKKRRLSEASEEGGRSASKSKAKATASHAEPEIPLSAEDKAYNERLEINRGRPSLGGKMKAACPVWSNTRRALLSSVDYLTNAVKTGGASVDVGPGKMARGIILEGRAPSDLHYWGRGEQGGTLMLPIGRPRARRREEPVVQVLDSSDEDIAAQVKTDDDFVPPKTSTGSKVLDHLPPASDVETRARVLEAPEIEALLMTHRARIPIAVTLAHDYSAITWRVPRAFIVLGWFWITDAWLEPVVTKTVRPDSTTSIEFDTRRVVWKFRFEFTGATQPRTTAWWQPYDEAEPKLIPTPTSEQKNASWDLWSTHGQASTSYTPAPLATHADRGENTESGRADIEGKTWRCSECNGVSARPYARLAYCINEACDKWDDVGRHIINNIDAFSDLGKIVRRERLQAVPLNLMLRPPEPKDLDQWASPQPKDAGREYWTGWVCHTCGCANERYKWRGWSCEGCKRSLTPTQIVYRDTNLRHPCRPISTGPRPDDGYASWHFEVSHAWTLFADDIKVIRHGVEAGFGKGTIIYHSLNHEGPPFAQRRVQVHQLFNDLQRPHVFITKQDNPLRRHIVNPKEAKHAERHLSQFYTMLLGPEPAPIVESLPTGRAIPWREADQKLLDLADMINERSGQIFPGEPERFNSLLIAASPPGLSATQAPRIYVPANSLMAFVYLGSDGVIKFRRPAGTGERVKQGQIFVQAGDVVGVQTGADGLDVIAHQDGFGFVCICRQIYRLDQEAVEIVNTPTASVDKEKVAPPRRIPNLPPPKPTKLPHVPLTFWYIGPFPLDPERPLKLQPSMRVRPSDIVMPIREHEEAEEGPKTYTGTEEDNDPAPTTVLAPPVVKGERKRKPVEGSEVGDGDKEKGKGKGGKGEKGEKGKGGVKGEGKSGDSSPAKKKSRKTGGVKA